MYGKMVELEISKDVIVRVWVWCTPDTSDEILKLAALDKLRSTIEKINPI